MVEVKYGEGWRIAHLAGCSAAAVTRYKQGTLRRESTRRAIEAAIAILRADEPGRSVTCEGVTL